MQQGEFTLHTLTHDVCRAQDDFSSLKLNLIDKETKKRMLEELWHDRVELPVEEAKAAEREMQVKKAAVEQLKKANPCQCPLLELGCGTNGKGKIQAQKRFFTFSVEN